MSLRQAGRQDDPEPDGAIGMRLSSWQEEMFGFNPVNPVNPVH
jgi:hypothetical protein